MKKQRATYYDEDGVDNDFAPGWIYFLVSANGWCKIGKTNNLHRRMGDYVRLQLPFSVELLFAFWYPDCEMCERLVHHLLRDHRLNGEWFSLDSGDLSGMLEFARDMISDLSFNHYQQYGMPKQPLVINPKLEPHILPGTM